jgi:hypothetical protein
MRPSRILGLLGALATACVQGTGASAPTAIVSGAVNTTIPVDVFGFPTDSAVVFIISPLDANPSLPFLLSEVDMEGTSLRTGTFTDANSLYATTEFSQEAALPDGGVPAQWNESFLAADPSSQTGAFSLTISSVGSTARADGGFGQWADSHGRLSATLPALTGDATGTVTVNITF